MRKGLFRLRALALGAAMVACSAAPAHAAGLINLASLPLIANTTACTTPVFSQPFAPWDDTSLYALAPGQTVNSFNGDGWILTTGAHVVSTRLASGLTAKALELPLAGIAISPPMCVTNDYPTARTMVRGPGGQSVLMSVLYSYRGLWGNLLSTGSIRSAGAWTASPVINIHPGPAVGWQWARFVLVGTSLLGPIDIYNFYVDPRMK